MIIHLIKNDITKLSVDAIVNAANSKLQAGGGVDGAIHRAGGKSIQTECNEIIKVIGRLPVGEAVITSAGKLNAKYIIHTVGPVWYGGRKNESELLKKCYVNSIKLAEEKKVKTLAFPNISTGVYGYPKDLAVKVVIEFIRDLEMKSLSVSEIYFICFDEENFNVYQKEFLSSGIEYLRN